MTSKIYKEHSYAY